MEEKMRKYSENAYRWLVLTPLAYIMEILLTLHVLWVGLMVMFFTIDRDYTSILIAYLAQKIPYIALGFIFLSLALINCVALVKRWHVPRAVCIVLNIAYLFVYLGAALVARPIPIGLGIIMAITTLTILSLFKLSNISVYDSRLR